MALSGYEQGTREGWVLNLDFKFQEPKESLDADSIPRHWLAFVFHGNLHSWCRGRTNPSTPDKGFGAAVASAQKS